MVYAGQSESSIRFGEWPENFGNRRYVVGGTKIHKVLPH
jgi:hypothetical protein